MNVSRSSCDEEENNTIIKVTETKCLKVVDNTGHNHYSFREALVHKLCSVSKFLPTTISVSIKGEQLTIEMEKLEKKLKNPTDENKITAWKSILQAVAVLNHFKIAHRDIKNGNIMYRNGVDAVLIDFGLSKTLYDGYHTPEVASEFFRAPELDKELELQKYSFEIDSWGLGIWAIDMWNKNLKNMHKFHICWNIKYNFVEYDISTDEERDITLMFHNINLKALGRPSVKQVPSKEDFLQVNEERYALYFKNIPKKILKMVESFLLPAAQRKTACDYVKIDSSRCLYTYPEEFQCPVPADWAECVEFYKAIYWSMKEYFKDEKDLVPLASLGCCYLLSTSLHPEDLCSDFNVDFDKMNMRFLEWFLQWSILKKK